MRVPAMLVLCVVTLTAAPLRAQSLDPSLLSGLAWRNVGPFRAGRVSAVSGVIGQPGVFYFGAPNGGIWKTTSAGETWYPIFDSVTTTSSIGAVEVAPSDPNVIYAGTGDQDSYFEGPGNGMFKSSDAGSTWRPIGLDGTEQIPSILVDPHDPRTLLVAALGPFRAHSETRGVFRSTDGGTLWTKTLYVDDQTGIEKLARADDQPDVIFATSLFHYFAPGPASPPPADSTRTRTRLYKSTDAGITWRELSGGGLPRLAGRTSIAVAMSTNAQRVYLIGDFGLYRSDDGGTSWRQMAADDKRIANGQGGFNCGVYVDSKNPDIVYTFSITAYRSTDGGNSFTGFKGGPPGGDDPQVMWIDPTDGRRILMGYDQGAIVSFNGGDTWSSWYNQSTEQIYHVATDNSFPYWIYGTQQDAGAIATRSRGNLGAITSLDWKPVPAWEWGTILPDPRDPNTVFSGGFGISKITYPSEEWINVGPDLEPSHTLRRWFESPLLFATWHGRRELLAGYQYVMATTDAGLTWSTLSPDLTVAHPATPVATGARRATRDTTTPGYVAIAAIAASPLSPGVMWVGTSNGILQVSRNHGATWTDITVPGSPVGPRPVGMSLEASPFDAGTAYAAIDAHYRGDSAPYIYRTRDYGKTWTKIVTGLPATAPSGGSVHVVRVDPKADGLLFAGTQSGIYVSFDAGDHWQSLMLNLPTTMFRDIAIHDNDLIVGTFGRGIWVLDDFAVLRQLIAAPAASLVHLFVPSDAIRVRHNVNYNTPFPREEPLAANPPDGATLY
ncbi:MAG: WD40/YVTN/BNR-like repeat-containing protein [Gemmatimonadales bacterium]